MESIVLETIAYCLSRLLIGCCSYKRPLVVAPHIMKKALHIIGKVPHTMQNAPHMMKKAPHIMRENHIRQCWRSIGLRLVKR